MTYTADFETTTEREDCRVWSYAICEIDNPDRILTGLDLDDFMAWAALKEDNARVYFHNLKFDGEFIISWLFKHGFTHVIDRKDLADKTFTTLISDKGIFYTMKIVFEKTKHKTNYIELYDSLKVLPFSVDKIAKGFNLPIGKGSIDYKKPRPVGYMPTPEEWDYIKTDCRIVALALKELFAEGLDRMTQGSNALKYYKDIITYKKFEKLFPVPEYDADIRQSYKGGYTYLQPRHANKDQTAGIVLDVNSLYPYVMHDKPLPYGEGVPFKGQYKKNNLYPLYVQQIICQFELKPGYLPTVQLKNNLAFVPTEYVTSSGFEDVPLTLTSVDLDLFLQHYDVMNIEYTGGWMFKKTVGLFTEYIDIWSERKIEAKKSGNAAHYTLAKLMLNSLYGKFAVNPMVRSKNPVDDHGIVRYILGEQEERTPLYIPVGTFITAWARDTTIRAAQSLYDRFIYADTDSLHLIGTDLPEGLKISDTDLGAWKHESNFDRARFIRAKSYIEHVTDPGKNDYKWKITCAGMPESCHEHVTWDNFRIGASYPGKLRPVHAVGGIVLEDIVFTIRA